MKGSMPRKYEMRGRLVTVLETKRGAGRWTLISKLPYSSCSEKSCMLQGARVILNGAYCLAVLYKIAKLLVATISRTDSMIMLEPRAQFDTVKGQFRSHRTHYNKPQP